jgi:hypothetical protein
MLFWARQLAVELVVQAPLGSQPTSVADAATKVAPKRPDDISGSPPEMVLQLDQPLANTSHGSSPADCKLIKLA